MYFIVFSLSYSRGCTMAQEKNRIWELDALRGLAVLGMITVHFIYDLYAFCDIEISGGPIFEAIKQNGGIAFILISGICATLGTKSIKRGALVFACGLAISGATRLLYALDVVNKYTVVRFGVLSLLGVCMLLWPLFSKRSPFFLALTGALFIVVGYIFLSVRVPQRFLYPLGLLHYAFYSADYFPVFPYLGYFLMGGAIGKTVYKNKRSLFGLHRAKYTFPLLRLAGRHSLLIYLVHQPLLYCVCMMINILK